MKKLLVGLLALGSMSAFAKKVECQTDIEVKFNIFGNQVDVEHVYYKGKDGRFKTVASFSHGYSRDGIPKTNERKLKCFKNKVSRKCLTH